MPQIKKVIDQKLLEHKNEIIAIPLSGGMDSNSILFSCVSNGIKCVAFSFRMEANESRDFKTARQNATELGVEFVEVVIPSDLHSIKTDLVNLRDNYSCVKKTDFECSRVMLYLYEEVRKRGIKVIASGLGAGHQYLESKKAVLHYKHRPDTYRMMMKEKIANKNAFQLKQHEILTREHGIKHIMPYATDEMFDTFKGISWEECMKGTFKKPAKRDYKEFLERPNIRVYAPQGYQLGDTGIAKSFEILLKSDWNIRECRTVTAIYNDLVNKKVG